MLSLAFLIGALVCFILAAVAIPTGRVNLLAAGLALWVASEMTLRIHG